MDVCRLLFGVCSLCVAGSCLLLFLLGCLLACFVRVVDLGGCWLLCFRCDVGLLLFAGLLCWILAVVVCCHVVTWSAGCSVVRTVCGDFQGSEAAVGATLGCVGALLAALWRT